MNIFFLSGNPRRCARWHCDKHVVKMILESTQILYTALHVNGGTAIIEASAPRCASTGKRGYKKHAAKHPSVLWASAALPHKGARSSPGIAPKSAKLLRLSWVDG